MIGRWYRTPWAQWIASTLVAAIEAAIFGLIALVAIIWGGETVVFGSSGPGIAMLAELSLILLLFVLPPLLVIAIVLLWPVLLGLSAMLWFPTRRSGRVVAPGWWISAGAATGTACGLLHFLGGTPAFDIVEGPFAPAVTLIWTTAIGAFGTWRLYRRLARMADPVASDHLCA